jgi:hypothetical protein
MITEADAGVAYGELLEKLRGINAPDLAIEIEKVVARGRLEKRKPHPIQERLPSTAALEIALRMLATWIEPALLVAEARILLSLASGAEVGDIRWAPDRLDIVEQERIGSPTSQDGQAVSVLPTFSEGQLDELRRSLSRIHELVAELAAEGE